MKGAVPCERQFTYVDAHLCYRRQVEALKGVEVFRRGFDAAVATECHIVKHKEDLRNEVVSCDGERCEQIVHRISEKLAKRDLRSRENHGFAETVAVSDSFTLPVDTRPRQTRDPPA